MVFDRLLKHVPKVCATDAQLVKLHHYETQFGIFDHDQGVEKDDPLALVRMHDAEQTNGRLFERIRQHHERKIYPQFGLSLTEFLALPREVVERLLELALDQQKRDNQTGEEQLTKLKKMTDSISIVEPTRDW